MLVRRQASGDPRVEVLLTGDAALLMDAIEFEQGPNLLVTMKGHGDRSAIACTLMALNQLRRSDSGVAIMPGHDGATMAALVARNVFVPGFR